MRLWLKSNLRDAKGKFFGQRQKESNMSKAYVPQGTQEKCRVFAGRQSGQSPPAAFDTPRSLASIRMLGTNTYTPDTPTITYMRTPTGTLSKRVDTGTLKETRSATITVYTVAPCHGRGSDRQCASQILKTAVAVAGLEAQDAN